MLLAASHRQPNTARNAIFHKAHLRSIFVISCVCVASLKVIVEMLQVVRPSAAFFGSNSAGFV